MMNKECNKQENQDIITDLYSFEFMELYEAFLEYSPRHRQGYLVMCSINMAEITIKYFQNQYNDKFTSNWHEIETNNSSEVANILEITCPNIEVTPLARTIYVCFNSDYTKFRYFTIEFHKSRSTGKKSYLLCECTEGGHLLFREIKAEENEIEVISKLFLEEGVFDYA